MTTKTDEQRADFEAWLVVSFPGIRIERREDQRYVSLEAHFMFEAYQAGRAALQSQDREDAVDRDVVAKQLRDMASSAYQTAMAFGVSQDNFERLAYQVFDNNGRILDHARRIEGDGE